MIRITTTALAMVGATAVLALAACGSSDDSSTSTSSAKSSGGVDITNAWARVTPQNAKAGAAYMTISSTGGDVLTGVSVPASIAGEAQLHETMTASSQDDSMSGSGTMSMKEVGKIAIPAGGSVALKPGGYHVMLMKLAKPITAGERVPLTLTFEKAGTVKVDAVTKDA